MRFANKVWWLCPVLVLLAACGPVPKEDAPPEELGTSEQAVNLAIPYISQYQGLTSSNCDCGPASVAMIVKYFGLGGGLSNSSLVAQVRARTGTSGCIDTNFGQLETAISSYGMTWSTISQYSSPAPSAQMTAMANATAANKPVIALVHGADLGRGEAYGDHWVVVKGFSADMQWVYLNDPDDQSAAGRPGWIVGGQITLSYSIFSTAALHASQRQGSPYGIIVTGPSGGGTSPWCSANCAGGGWWCAGDGACIQNGVAGHNYHCPGNNMAPDRDQACARGCHIAAAGYPDYCNYGTYCGGGSWCGNDCVGGEPTTLYNFSGGALSSITQCSVGSTYGTCAIAAPGYPDYCH